MKTYLDNNEIKVGEKFEFKIEKSTFISKSKLSYVAKVRKREKSRILQESESNQ